MRLHFSNDTMGSVSTDVEVKRSKSRKRGKRKDGGKGGEKGDDNNRIERSDEGTGFNKKQSKRKRKAKNVEANGTGVENTENNGRDISLESGKDKESETELNDVRPAKRKKKEKETNERVTDEEQEEDADSVKAPKKPSKRQLKREKAEKREQLKREAVKLEAMNKALNYVSKWKHARSEWKFEKLKQNWLMQNLLDDTLIPDDIFPTVLEYFEGCKGMAREQLLKKGMNVIKQVEEDEERRDEIMESVAYKRARKLLQALPTDT